MAKLSKKSRLKKQRKEKLAAELEEMRDIADDVIESDFVPYACLIDPETLVTKDGELLQIIKITGEGVDNASIQKLRAQVRNAIAHCLPDTSYAVWLHTLRRQKNLLPPSHFPDAFSGKLEAAWRTQYPASASFVNEIYLSVVKKGQSASFKDPRAVLRGFLARRDMRVRMEYLEAGREEIAAVTQHMLELLRPFGGRLLTVVERGGVMYGEHLEFLEKLINLEERPMEMPERDLSFVLTSGEIAFGFNAMEVRTAEEKRRFATILTLKEYKESSLLGINAFLEIPCELIVSESFDFAGRAEVEEAYAKQAHYLQMSGDAELAQWMEIDRLIATDETDEEAKTFGKQQTTLFLIAPSVRQLEANLRLVQKSLGRLGIVHVREDLRFEECYWAQLPANFAFLTRQIPVHIQHFAGFANLQNQPIGNRSGSPWGAPIVLYSTLQGTPYFFNFHRGQAAHTVVVGTPSMPATSTAHFLLANGRKTPMHIWYLDGLGRGRPFLKALGGTMHRLGGEGAIKLNPLHMTDTPVNREFLAIWLSSLVDPYAHGLTATSLEFFRDLVAATMTLPLEHRRLSTLLPLLRNEDPMLAHQFKVWCEGGEWGHMFDNPVDEFKVGACIGWDLSPYLQNPALRIPIASYLLQRITGALAGEIPVMLVMQEGFTLLDTPIFSGRIQGWCAHLNQKNAACMVVTQALSSVAELPSTRAFSEAAASIFVHPDPAPTVDYATGLGFEQEDLAALVHLKADREDILLKRGDQSHVLRQSFKGLGGLHAALAGEEEPVAPAQDPAAILAALMAKKSEEVP